MILFIIIIGMIFLLSLMFFLLCTSNLELEVKELNFNSNNLKGKKAENYLIYIRLKALKRFTWVKLKIDESKIKNFKVINNKILKKINGLEKLIVENRKAIFTRENINQIKKLEIKIEKIDLSINLDVADTIFTVILVTLISTVLSIILAKKMDKDSIEKCRYVVNPIYNQKAQINLKLNCIINVKMVHIINIVYMLLKKRSASYDERTSNRRAYVCHNE